ncbi:unnamed protein product [Phaedon cochleariae]|uniref:FP protein C-terminal domain-containing protein n=1 Tax=Phaedon cochleariae TaxID=80249 RepID=A0A9N9X4I2_PHACE|nr:unnamed protein product [Phaedon cochleariae]
MLQEFFEPVRKHLEEEMQELKKSVEYMSDCFDRQKENTEELITKIKLIAKENEELNQRVLQLENKLNWQEQREKEKNLILCGVPDQLNKNTNQITMDIARTVSVSIKEDDIESSYRVNKKDSAPILVKLRTIEKKKEMIIAAKKMRGIKVNDCGLEGTNRNIFFNDDLTLQTQMLFKKTRDLRKEKNYKSAYCIGGKIFLRKTDSDNPIRIHSENDLVQNC